MLLLLDRLYQLLVDIVELLKS